MRKKILKFWNGRPQQFSTHRAASYFVAAYTKKQARELIAKAADRPTDYVSQNEITDYYNEGGWGNRMADKEKATTEPCCYVVHNITNEVLNFVTIC